MALGAPVFTYHVEGFGPHVPEGSRLFQLTCDPALAAWASAGDAVVTSLKPGIAELLAGAEPEDRKSPVLRTAPELLSGKPLSDAYVFQQIAALRASNTIIVEEAPSSRPQMQRHLSIINRDGFYTCASGGLGHGLPAAIGVALGRPSAKVIALLGDGSAMYAIQGLWTAAQLDLPISFVVLNNGRYEALEQFGQLFGLQKLEGTKLPGLDFVALARAQGVAGRVVKEAADLDAALTESFNAGGPTLVEVILD
ncbi:MAG: hypothetical protein GW822_14540 [Sphingomonadales bacterium]|nr:hypothetical protein [Sphingomonadales bacterium]